VYSKALALGIPFEANLGHNGRKVAKPKGVQDMGAHKSTVNLRKKIKRRLKNERTKARASEKRNAAAGT